MYRYTDTHKYKDTDICRDMFRNSGIHRYAPHSEVDSGDPSPLVRYHHTGLSPESLDVTEQVWRQTKQDSIPQTYCLQAVLLCYEVHPKSFLWDSRNKCDPMQICPTFEKLPAAFRNEIAPDNVLCRQGGSSGAQTFLRRSPILRS